MSSADGRRGTRSSAKNRLPGIPISLEAPLDWPGPAPGIADVVVVGGGIVGLMSAWHCARAGLRAVLVEKGRLAGEQSGRNWGWIRQQGRDPAELPIMIEANRLWRALPQSVQEAVGLAPSGVLYKARTTEQMARYERWMDHARAHALDTRLLTGDGVAALLPGATERWVGGLYTASDMTAAPWRAVPALARAAAEDGVAIVENCAVRGLQRSGGRVTGVVTEAGAIAAPEVIVAAGAWSRLFLRREGVAIPQLSVRASVCATGPLSGGPSVAAVDDRLAFRKRDDGGYTLAPDAFHEFAIGPDAVASVRAFLPQLRADPFGTRFQVAAPRGFPDAWSTPRRWHLDEVTPFERMRILDPAPNLAKLDALAVRFASLFPALGPVRLRAAWAGMIDTMPDQVPIVDRVASVPGLTLATGMSGHGFGIAPAFGRIVADLVQGKAPGHDLSRFRLGRFSDGSAIRPDPGL